jgi:hypothetical protein
MTSSKAKRRVDKRDRFTGEPSPELAAALEQIAKPIDDPDVIVTKHGTTMNLRQPWPFPTGSKEDGKTPNARVQAGPEAKP